METFIPYEPWKQSFENSRLGKLALQALQNKLQEENEANFLMGKQLILRACHQAAVYQQQPTNPKVSARKLQQKLSANARKTIKEINTLFTLLENAEGQAENALNAGMQACLEHAKSDASLYHLRSQLHALKLGLLNDIAPNQQGAECTWVFGCLRYPAQSNNPNPLDIAVNGLAFQLEWIFRNWSSRERQAKGRVVYFRMRNMDEMTPVAMPPARKGNPYYPLIASFINAALFPDIPGRYTGNTIKTRIHKLLKDHPGIEYVGWQL